MLNFAAESMLMDVQIAEAAETAEVNDPLMMLGRVKSLILSQYLNFISFLLFFNVVLQQK